MNLSNGYLEGSYKCYCYDKERMSAFTREILFEGNFKNGIKHGYWKSNNVCGSSFSEGKYYWGKKNSSWKENLTYGTFENDKKEGLWVRKDKEGNV